MRHVLWPELIQRLWDEEPVVKGQVGMLYFLADYVSAGVPPVIAHTDPALFKNLMRGMARLHRLGWHHRLKPGPLRARAAAMRRKKREHRN